MLDILILFSLKQNIWNCLKYSLVYLISLVTGKNLETFHQHSFWNAFHGRNKFYIKDRKTGGTVVVGWHYIGDYFVPLEIQCRYHIPLSKLVSSLFIDINHVKITLSETIWVYSIYEK